MKICFVTYTLNHQNGYGRVSQDLIRGLARLGVQGPILTIDNKNIPPDIRPRVIPKLAHDPTSPFSNPLALLKDHKLIAKYSKDCNGIHFLTESFLSTAFREYSTPYLVTIYGTWALRPLNSHIFSKWFFTSAYKKAKSIVSISDFTKNRLKQIIPTANVSTIHLGIDPDKWTSPSKKASKGSGIHILTVGSLNRAKGLDVSVEAVSKFSHTTNKSVTYTIVSGRRNKNIEKRLKSIAKGKKFTNLSFKYQITDHQLKQLYHQAHVFLLTPKEVNQDFEGFGLIFLEAFASNLPVITSRSGAIPEIVKHKRTGLLVSEGNVGQIVKALGKLTNNTKLRSLLPRQAKTSLKYFSTTRMSQDYLQLYSQVFAS